LHNVASLISTNLTGVSCTSPSSCTAINGTGQGTPVEEWNGSQWTVQPSNAFPYVLHGISCTSALECTAVGCSDCFGSTEKPQAGVWDGSNLLPQNTPSGVRGGLNAVSCTTLANCVAVGEVLGGTGGFSGVPLVEEYH
jgi:hypothetical protein